MTKPQQPELARSGRSEVDPGAVKTRHGGPTDTTGPAGPIPEDNLPGHHPAHDQDKPEGPPPKPRSRRATGTATATATATKTKTAPTDVVEGQATATITDLGSSRPTADQDQRKASFRFDFEPRIAPLSYALAITPMTTRLDVADGQLRVRFGAWQVCTPLDNIEGAEVTGPYNWLKVAGPPHLSLRDRGVTFATSTKRGVCIRFREPVSALLPKALFRHPALTVTVEEPERLVEVLTGS